MMNLVVDSSVAVKWFITETHTAEALRIKTDYENGGLNLLAPDLIYAEFGNIIWKKQVFQGLNAIQAEEVIEKFLQLQINVAQAQPLLDIAYQIAATHKRTVYDSLYIALSQREQCQFVTADEKLVNAISGSFPNVIWLANWP